MKIDVLSLFPEMFSGFLKASILGIAIDKQAVEVKVTDFRAYTRDKHKRVDDYAYGGFAGMVLQPQPIHDALYDILQDDHAPVIYFTPQGRQLNQSIVEHYAGMKRVVLLCGHYKEVDQRVRDLYVSDEISLGDYVLSGGELAAMVFIDALARLQPGVLGDSASAQSDSFSNADHILGFPCYSRPVNWMGLKVPDVLCSGNHKLIQKWADEASRSLTRTRRPDLKKK